MSIECGQCGEITDSLHDGYCEQCYMENQQALDSHNHEYDHWNRLDNERREEEIRNSFNYK